MSFEFQNYIFDLDGTVINSSKEVIECMYKALIKSGIQIDKSELTSNMIGPPLKQIIQNIVPYIHDESKLSEILENFREIYDNDKNDISEIYNGVYETLDMLKENGCRLFMATFKPEAPTMRIIEQFKLDYFEDIYTIDKFKTHISKEEMIKDIIKRYSLNIKETVMIGDAPSDIEAAKAAGVFAIGALWGYGDNKKPLTEKADRVISSIGELCQK